MLESESKKMEYKTPKQELMYILVIMSLLYKNYLYFRITYCHVK